MVSSSELVGGGPVLGGLLPGNEGIGYPAVARDAVLSVVVSLAIKDEDFLSRAAAGAEPHGPLSQTRREGCGEEDAQTFAQVRLHGPVLS